MKRDYKPTPTVGLESESCPWRTFLSWGGKGLKEYFLSIRRDLMWNRNMFSRLWLMRSDVCLWEALGCILYTIADRGGASVITAMYCTVGGSHHNHPDPLGSFGEVGLVNAFCCSLLSGWREISCRVLVYAYYLTATDLRHEVWTPPPQCFLMNGLMNTGTTHKLAASVVGRLFWDLWSSAPSDVPLGY